ncbi:hypothetical protein ACFWAY_48975 [Rhodococcus sp. NPDC059968]
MSTTEKCPPHRSELTAGTEADVSVAPDRLQHLRRDLDAIAYLEEDSGLA